MFVEVAEEIRTHLVSREARVGCVCGEGQTTPVFSFHSQLWRRLIQPDAEALELFLDEELVCDRLEHVEHYKDEIRGTGR